MKLLQKILGAREWLLIHDPIIMRMLRYDIDDYMKEYGSFENIKVYVSKAFSVWLMKYVVVKFTFPGNDKNSHFPGKQGVAYVVVSRHKAYKWVVPRKEKEEYNLFADRPLKLTTLLHSQISRICEMAK